MKTLEKYKKNFYSQSGEDGITEKIFEIIGTRKGWCVEFGAWDGIHFSNTYHLINDRKWRGVLIEANTRKYNQLVKNLEGTGTVCINSFVEPSGRNTLDNILSKTQIPSNFDLLSIDIDGNDYHIWKSLKTYKPKLVIIEFNPTIPLEVEFVQPQTSMVHQGSSLAALVKMAKNKGYNLIATTHANAFFVHKKYFPLFNIADNRASSIWTGREKTISYLFQLFDGTIVIKGNRQLLWHGIEIEDKNIQVLPKIFRHFPPRWFDKIAGLIYMGNWRQIGKIFRKK